MLTHLNFEFHKRLLLQISVLVTVVTVATITYLSVSHSHRQAASMMQQLRHQAVVVAENLAAATGSYVITRNYTTIENILLRAARFESIISMQIVDVNGKTLSNVVKDNNGQLTPTFNKLHFEIPKKHELILNQYQDILEIFQPVVLGDVVGWVRIVYSLDAIKHEEAAIWTSNLTSGFIIIIITIAILIVILRKPVVSIEKYTDFAEKLTQFTGAQTKVDRRSIELFRLGSALNRASLNLYSQHGRLKTILRDMERIAAIAEHSPDIILSVNIDGSIEYLNTTAKNTIKELFESDEPSDILKLMPDSWHKILKRCLTKDASMANIESFLCGNAYLWKFTPLKQHNAVHCHATNITEKKLAENQLTYQANYDLLTDLPNRLLALDRLKQSIKRSRRLKSHTGVLFLGVERLNTVTDTLGHRAGDKIIKEIAVRLTGCIREGDTLARFGGGVFLIILNDLRSALDSKVVAEKTMNTMSEEFIVDNRGFRLGLSIGISSCPDDESDTDKLIRNADIAMQKARENGGNTYQFFDSKFNEQALIKVEMESELRHALDKNEFFLTFQPQIDIVNNKLIGAEALIRWINPKLGFVPPDRFIAVAEDTGLIIPIGEWVLRTACCEAKKWQETLGMPLRVAVNVSARQFIGHDFPATVRRILEETDLSAKNLELEITESLLVEDAQGVVSAINQLKEIGVTLALDDFGTGYSSLSYLKRFPFDILKIDRAFVKDVIENPEDASLCKAIVAIATSLNLMVIGEGVETQEQLEYLRFIGTNIAQGYLYSKPLEVTAFIEYVETHFSIEAVQL